jgi:hypothetical protein
MGEVGPRGYDKEEHEEVQVKTGFTPGFFIPE